MSISLIINATFAQTTLKTSFLSKMSDCFKNEGFFPNTEVSVEYGDARSASITCSYEEVERFLDKGDSFAIDYESSTLHKTFTLILSYTNLKIIRDLHIIAPYPLAHQLYYNEEERLLGEKVRNICRCLYFALEADEVVARNDSATYENEAFLHFSKKSWKDAVFPTEREVFPDDGSVPDPL
jgi:hypothetical protein